MSQLKRLAGLAGYALHDGVAYGRTNSIYFNVTYNPSDSAVTVRAYIRPIESLTFRDTGRGSGIHISRINEYLKVRSREFPNDGAQADERSVWTTLGGAAAPDADKTASFLFEFSRFLMDQGYASSCAMCPGTRQLGYAMQNGQVLEVCPICRNRYAGTLKPLAHEHNASGSCLCGVLGAVLGCVAGIVPWVLLGSLGYVAAVSGLLMAYFAYKGYRLLGGKRNSSMFLILVVALAVFAYIAVTLAEGVNAYRELAAQGQSVGLFEEIGVMMTALFHPEAYDTSLLWVHLGAGWLFAAIGCFALMRRFRRESTGKDISAPHAGRRM